MITVILDPEDSRSQNHVVYGPAHQRDDGLIGRKMSLALNKTEMISTLSPIFLEMSFYFPLLHLQQCKSDTVGFV